MKKQKSVNPPLWWLKKASGLKGPSKAMLKVPKPSMLDKQ